jgi:3-dehydroquinate synthase
MNTHSTIRVTFPASSSTAYSIHVGVSLSQIARDITDRFPNSAKFVVTDLNVHRLYRKQLQSAFQRDRIDMLVIPPGERSKSRKAKEKLEDALIRRNVERDSLIIAFGGGVVGDLAGFVAATMLRGIPYVHIPTTLLAQVDSSVGGKVGVDHPSGKNLIGAFHQPKRVYIDLETLDTLPDREFRNGMSEVIKTGAILDRELFTFLEGNAEALLQRDRVALGRVIARCCERKASVVKKDERESGYRRILNFGHTIGHAIEHLTNYRVAHGEAIAIGMTVETKMAVNGGLTSRRTLDRLSRLIQSFGLPTDLPKQLSPKTVIDATMNDKKSRRGIVHYTLLREIGSARVGTPIPKQRALQLLHT